MAPEPYLAKPKVRCTKQEQLSYAVLQALRVLVALETGPSEIPRPTINIQAAREDWFAAKRAYFDHLRRHGC